MDMSDGKGRCDLHSHTLASDGMQPPRDNVRLAAQRGLSGVAVTDHDTVAGIEEALEAGNEYGVDVVPGVEISTRAGGRDIHVLGYFVDHKDQLLSLRLAGLRETRNRRNEEIIRKLQNLGIGITLDAVVRGIGRELKPDESVGRPHIADELVRIGSAESMRDAFDRYLAEGAAAFVSPPRISPGEAGQWIREAGGAAVLAHPGLYGDDALVRSILEEGGWSGIEVFHSDHGEAENVKYAAMAEQYGLIMTGGSDYHGARQGVVFHGDLGSVTVGAETIEQLRAAAAR